MAVGSRPAGAVTFGLIIPQRGVNFGVGTLAELLDLGVRADGSGLFDAVWVGDSLTAAPRPESITCLAALAGMTTHVRLGVACMASFPVRDPGVLAYQWATLDQISQGRALLAVCNGLQGSGASAREGENFGGVPDRERSARLEEHVGLVRRLWSGEPVDFDGRFTRYHALRILPTPVQDPCPIWIAANPRPGSKTWTTVLRRVALLGDGFQTAIMAPGTLAAMWAEVRSHLADAGKDAGTFPVAAYHSVNIGPDREACLDEALRFFLEYYGPAWMTREVATSMTATGTVDECRDQILEVVDQGANHVMLRMAAFDQGRQWDLLVNELLPSVLVALG